MLLETEKLLRGSLKDLENQRKLLRQKQRSHGGYNEDLSNQANYLGRSAALLSAEIRKFESQDTAFARGMGEDQEFSLGLEWAASLSKERLTELHKAVGKLLKSDRGVL